jgi:hypothetical protein
MASPLRQLALVSKVSGISPSDLSRTGAALQKQASRDLAPIWEVQATVDVFPKLEDVPLGYWPIIIVEQDPDLPPDAAGIHLDKDNQPFALVMYSDGWSLTASHEALEMLVDPFGNRLIAGDSPKQDQGRVEFLVEVCDPSEAVEFAYTVNGITVSDFYTPHYFDPVQAPGVRYSYTGALPEPRQVLRGGYLTWHDLVSDEWWQEIYFGDQPQFRNLGRLSALGGSLRAHIDRLTEVESLKAMFRRKTSLTSAQQAFTRMITRPSETKAQIWLAQIEALKAGSSGSAAAETERRRAPRKGTAQAEETEEREPTGPERRRPPRKSKESE